MDRSPELYAKIGADQLRRVVTDFYSRVFGDLMIGFMFEGKDRARLIEKEWELAATFLGAPDVKYTGRPMRTAHANSPIFGGHFERRLQILRETMRDNQVDPDVQRVWLEHTQALRPQITRDKGSECRESQAAAGSSDAALKLAVALLPADPDKKIKLGRK